MMSSFKKIEYKLMAAACLIMIATSLLSIYSLIHAQNQSASVTAVVLPNEFNTRSARQKNFFERLTLSEKITYSSLAGLVVSGSLLSYLLFASRRGNIHARVV